MGVPCTNNLISDWDANGHGLQRTQLVSSTTLNPAAIPGQDGQLKLAAPLEQHQPRVGPVHHRHRRLHEAGRASHNSFPAALMVDEAHSTSGVPAGCASVPAMPLTEQRNTCPQLRTQRSPQEQVLEQGRDDSTEGPTVDREVRNPMTAHKCDPSPTPSAGLCFDCDATSDTANHEHGAIERCTPSRGGSGGVQQRSETHSAPGTRCTPQATGSSCSARHDTAEARWQSASRIPNSACSSHVGSEEAQWAQRIRHSVAGALDEAMEALEAELGYRSTNKTACGSVPMGSNVNSQTATVVTPRLSDLASIDVGDALSLFRRMD